MNIEDAWEYLTENGIADEETLYLVVAWRGYTLETLETVLYVRTGYRSFDQLESDDK